MTKTVFNHNSDTFTLGGFVLVKDTFILCLPVLANYIMEAFINIYQ